MSHWSYTQKLVAAIEVEPKDYADECFRIYRYFQLKKTSPAYAVKILRILSAWGQFYVKEHGGTGIMEVKMPRGKHRHQAIRKINVKQPHWDHR
jgi:hypothetical protein